MINLHVKIEQLMMCYLYFDKFINEPRNPMESNCWQAAAVINPKKPVIASLQAKIKASIHGRTQQSTQAQLVT